MLLLKRGFIRCTTDSLLGNDAWERRGRHAQAQSAAYKFLRLHACRLKWQERIQPWGRIWAWDLEHRSILIRVIDSNGRIPAGLPVWLSCQHRGRIQNSI